MRKKLDPYFKYIYFTFLILVSLFSILILFIKGTEINVMVRYGTNEVLTDYHKDTNSLEESRRKLRVAVKSHKINTLKKNQINENR